MSSTVRSKIHTSLWFASEAEEAARGVSGVDRESPEVVSHVGADAVQPAGDVGEVGIPVGAGAEDASCSGGVSIKTAAVGRGIETSQAVLSILAAAKTESGEAG